jgi:hypothetical protein
MRLIFIIFSLFFLFCTSSEKGVELEVLTKHLNAADVELKDYGMEYIKDVELAIKQSRTVVTYKLTNHTNKTYYFNVDGYQDDEGWRDIKLDKASLIICDEKGKKVVSKRNEPSLVYDANYIFSEYLEYSHVKKKHSKNFFLHPAETLYFEWYVVLPFGNLSEGVNYCVVLDKQQKYSGQVLIGSTLNKKTISRTDLKTIEENHYQIFDGVVTSNNTVPIVINQIDQH